VQLKSRLQEEELDARPALSEFLERLCLVLYDSLRPLIIQVRQPTFTIVLLYNLLISKITFKGTVQRDFNSVF
jgi:hypothetical protein